MDVRKRAPAAIGAKQAAPELALAKGRFVTTNAKKS